MYSRSILVCALSFGLFASPAFASPSQCPTEAQHATLGGFRDRVAGAESPAAARRMALQQTRLGHKAIDQARRAFPGEPGLVAAEAKLDGFEAGVRAANTQGEVAAQIDTLNANVGMNCDYSGVEIVVIVIGFILGILPGILFLFLFC